MLNSLADRFTEVRKQTLALSRPLSDADLTIQAAEFASPGKWHLAHTTWFFEEFILAPSGRRHPDFASYQFLFNSYYETIGKRQPQKLRGLLSRPSLEDIWHYREAVEHEVLNLLQTAATPELEEILELGLHHEQQHQELFLTDILYTLAQNPLLPAYHALASPPGISSAHQSGEMIGFAGGLVETGHQGQGFGFDNEFPRHRSYLDPYALCKQLITNAEWLAFIEDDGYQNPLLWLSDGWKTVQTEGWIAPLYWQSSADQFQRMTLAGVLPLDLQAPVSHISYFEADAFARWAGKRLPTEAEWENAAEQHSISGHFSDRGIFEAQASSSLSTEPLQQLYGDVWEWTSSPYVAYPGFRARAGAVGEYNGKFMNGQYVLKGGSCVTPLGHIRASYRNFFYPHQRWQFTGLRLAEDQS